MAKRGRLIVTIALAALTFAAYYRAFDCEFLSIDDPIYVTKNPHVREGLTGQSISWAFTTTRSANWHPLTWLSHQLDYALFGLRPWGHHLTALLFHTANVVILFLALSAMTGALWRSMFVAALFAVHPLHLESAAWVAERKDVLSALFWMLTMVAYARYATNPSIGRYALVALAFALGLMSKPMLVSLPIVLLLLDYWPLKRLQVAGYRLQKQGAGSRGSGARGRGRGGGGNSQSPIPNSQLAGHLLLEKVPLFALAIASSVVTFLVQQTGGAMRTTDQYTIGVRVANAVVAYVSYIAKMIWPARLSIFYPHPTNKLPAWIVISCALLLTAVTYAAIRAARSRPYVTVGWLWYLVTLVPVIGLVQVGRQAMADRYTYIPLVGLFIIVAWGAPDLISRVIASTRVRRAALGIAASLVIAACAVTTWSDLAYWRGPVEVFEHALQSTRGHYGVHYLLADALLDVGKRDQAIRHLEQAIKANPRFAPAYVSLGQIRLGQGRPDQAVALYEDALRIDPKLASAHNNLGYVLLQQGHIDRAIEHFKQAIENDARPAQAHYNLGVAYDKLGNLPEAVKHYEAAVRIDSDMPDAHFRLATALTRQGLLDDATGELEEALRLKPDMPEAHFYMGYVLSMSNEPERAISHLHTAIRLKPKWSMAHYGLADALFRTGDYAAAWRELHRSIALGYEPNPAFVEALSRKMPDPGSPRYPRHSEQREESPPRGRDSSLRSE